MKNKKVFAFFWIVLTILSLFTGCNESEGSTLENLEDTVWILESYGPQDNPNTVLADTEITARFDSSDQKITGSGGCNDYTVNYEISGNILTLQAPTSSTMMACGEEKDQQEQDFLNILQSAQSYQISDGMLTINCSDSILVFNPE